MGPPLRSFAADAHDCIVVWVPRPTGYKVVALLIAPASGLIAIPIAASVQSRSKLPGERSPAGVKKGLSNPTTKPMKQKDALLSLNFLTK